MEEELNLMFLAKTRSSDKGWCPILTQMYHCGVPISKGFDIYWLVFCFRKDACLKRGNNLSLNSIRGVASRFDLFHIYDFEDTILITC